MKIGKLLKNSLIWATTDCQICPREESKKKVDKGQVINDKEEGEEGEGEEKETFRQSKSH